MRGEHEKDVLDDKNAFVGASTFQSGIGPGAEVSSVRLKSVSKLKLI